MHRYRRFPIEFRNEHRDDLALINDIYALENFNYVDIKNQEKLQQIMHQWPLFKELQAIIFNHQSQ